MWLFYCIVLVLYSLALFYVILPYSVYIACLFVFVLSSLVVRSFVCFNFSAHRVFQSVSFAIEFLKRIIYTFPSICFRSNVFYARQF